MSAIDPLLDNPAVSVPSIMSSSLKDKWSSVKPVRALVGSGKYKVTLLMGNRIDSF